MAVPFEKEETKQEEAATLHLYLKVRDEFTCSVKNSDGKEVIDYEGYVPSFMPGEHYGDYVILDIDIETGKILNWVKPTSEGIESMLRSPH